MSDVPHTQEDAFAPAASMEGERYFFDIHEGERFRVDEEGVLLNGLEEVKAEALRALPDIAREAKVDGARDFVVEVRDQTGRKLLRVRLSLVVEPLA